MRVKKERLERLKRTVKRYTGEVTGIQKKVGKGLKKLGKEFGGSTKARRVGGFKPATKKEISELVKKSLKKRK